MSASPATHADLITALAVAETELARAVRAAGKAVASGRTRVVAAGEALAAYRTASASARPATEPAPTPEAPAAGASAEPVATPLAPLPALDYLPTRRLAALLDDLVAARPGCPEGARQCGVLRDEIARRWRPAGGAAPAPGRGKPVPHRVTAVRVAPAPLARPLNLALEEGAAARRAATAVYLGDRAGALAAYRDRLALLEGALNAAEARGDLPAWDALLARADRVEARYAALRAEGSLAGAR